MDDTVEVREVHSANDGRDPFPVLIQRQKLAKDRNATTCKITGYIVLICGCLIINRGSDLTTTTSHCFSTNLIGESDISNASDWLTLP